MNLPHGDPHHHGSSLAAALEVDLKNAYNGGELAGMEKCFVGLPGVSAVHLDRTAGMAHITYDPSATTPEALQAAIRRLGYHCDCSTCDASSAQPGHPCLGNEHPGGDRTAALTASTPPSGNSAPVEHSGHAMPMAAAPDPHAGHKAMGHGDASSGDEHAGHGKGMVDDLLRRFIVSMILAIPVLAFSPMGALVGLPAMPPFGLSMAIWGFVLGTPVVLWGGWPFISAAARALR